MRLSFGQELRMVQKQILAPRMIQSMEILQLPIMALQERIEQEIQENEALEAPGTRSRSAGRGSRSTKTPTRPPSKSASWSSTKRKTTKTISNACCSSTKSGPTISKSAAAPRPRGWKKKANASTTPWPTPSIAPNRSTIICTISSVGSSSSRAIRQLCDQIIYNLDANGYLQGRLEDLVDPDAAARRNWNSPAAALWPLCKSSIRPASAPAI